MNPLYCLLCVSSQLCFLMGQLFAVQMDSNYVLRKKKKNLHRMIKFVHAREFLVTFYGCIHGGKVIHEVHEGNFDYCCSVAKLCLILCGPTDCSMPGIPVLHYLAEFVQIHAH